MKMRTRKPAERKLFELTQEERDKLQGFIDKPPKGATRITQLDSLIRAISLRVSPYYAEGKGMVEHDLRQIDHATSLLGTAEDALRDARTRLNRTRRNLHYLYSGTGMPE
jgi:hypothetical protein